jgi:pimeloyl-ACP methyl ester carboxylesterase
MAVLLPGILMPAFLRYAPLIDALGQDVRALPKELEVYAGDQPPHDYSITTELDGLDRFLDERGADAVHLYGHSAGGSVALAYAAARPDRVLSLAVDEPASDFSDEDRAALREQLPEPLADLPAPERMRAFVTSLLRPGVAPPTPTAPPPGPETAKRPQGLVAFEGALHEHELEASALNRFTGPVYFSYGALSSPRWEQMSARASSRWPTCRVERYEGLHHLNTSHQAEPGRVAAALRNLWDETASRP